MPLYLNYSRGYELVEWIELNRILGAEKFNIYVESCAPNVQDILRYYNEIGIVEVIQWPLPVERKDIHYFGQVVALQDCLYRNKEASEYIVNVDLDEFIIPHTKDVFTWKGIVNNTDAKSRSFIFRNTFFRKEWLEKTDANNFTGNDIAEKYNLITLLLSEHETKLFPFGQRSKYFAKTALATSLLIHDVVGAGVPVRVPHDVAMMHHYRNWYNYSNVEKKIKDNTVLQKYGDYLIRNVHDTWNRLPNVSFGLTHK